MPPKKTYSTRLEWIVLLAVAVIVLVIVVNNKHSRRAAIAVGKPAPQIQAVGWVNGPGPTNESLRGKVVVLDIWATWCGPCRAAGPHLVGVQQKYKDKGVQFISLTDEGNEALPEIERFLKQVHIDWPNGYGAVETIASLGVEAIPFFCVIDPNGTVVWTIDSGGELEAGIELALARKATK